MFASCTPTVEAELRDSLRADMGRFMPAFSHVSPKQFGEYLRATSDEVRADWRRAVNLGALSRSIADLVRQELATA